MSIDSTVQEKNITYPTDAKLHKKIIGRCVKTAREQRITLRRSYARTSKQLLRDTYNGTPPRRRKTSNLAKRKLKTIAGRLVRELERKLPAGGSNEDLILYKQVLTQEKYSKHKIYSLHEPEVYCMSKGKAHKKYEYGCKASVTLTQVTGIIVGAMTFKRPVYDGHTLEPVLEQVQKLRGTSAKTASVDRGYQGKQEVSGTKIKIPSPPKQHDSAYSKRKKRVHHRRRSARNFLKGRLGDSFNFMLAASGFNYKKLMKKLKREFFWFFFQISICSKIERLGKIYFSKTVTYEPKMTF